jgi:hypothetical protein
VIHLRRDFRLTSLPFRSIVDPESGGHVGGDETMRLVLVTFSLIVPLVAVATEANALCNRKVGSQCVSATLSRGWNSDCTARCIVTVVPIGDNGEEKEVQVIFDPDASEADIPNEIDLRKEKQD